MVYLATCNFCAKQYVGNTPQALKGRITGHRNNTDSVLKAHAIVHRDDFDNSFSFHVRCCSIKFWRKKPSGFTDLE